MVLQARKLGKTVYLFSVDSDDNKIAHVNFVSDPLKEKGLDARTWALKISEIIGGKVCTPFCPSLYMLNVISRQEEKRIVRKDQA